MFKGIDAQRLVAVFVGGWLVLTIPLLGLWDQGGFELLGYRCFPQRCF